MIYRNEVRLLFELRWWFLWDSSVCEWRGRQWSVQMRQGIRRNILRVWWAFFLYASSSQGCSYDSALISFHRASWNRIWSVKLGKILFFTSLIRTHSAQCDTLDFWTAGDERGRDFRSVTFIMELTNNAITANLMFQVKKRFRHFMEYREVEYFSPNWPISWTVSIRLEERNNSIWSLTMMRVSYFIRLDPPK